MNSRNNTNTLGINKPILGLRVINLKTAKRYVHTQICWLQSTAGYPCFSKTVWIKTNKQTKRKITLIRKQFIPPLYYASTSSESFPPKGVTQKLDYCYLQLYVIIFMCSLLSPLCLPTKDLSAFSFPEQFVKWLLGRKTLERFNGIGVMQHAVLLAKVPNMWGLWSHVVFIWDVWGEHRCLLPL